MSLKSRISESGDKEIDVGLAPFHSLPVTLLLSLNFFSLHIRPCLIRGFNS